MQTTYPNRAILPTILPRTAVVSVALMVGFALLTALAAQIRIPVPGSPVPITGQTFAVLLSGAALGSRLGAGSMGIYWMLGAIGLPFYTEASGGWEAAFGATGGYLFGFVVAAWVVGRLAERGQDRKVITAIPAFLIGSAVIYAFGVVWLWISVDSITSLSAAIDAGLTPFLVGDLLKAVLAGLLLPAAWKFLDYVRS